MRKIISVLVVLGLVLGMMVMATPVSALTTRATVTLGNDCQGAASNYTIVFNITAELQTGSNHIIITFPEDTTVPATFANSRIFVGATAVFGAEVTVVDRTVKFMVPADVPVGPVTVLFVTAAGLKNPTTPGLYNVYVSTDRPQDATPRLSLSYRVRPTYSTFKYVMDFSPTYEGIAADFVPPFKACGQEDYGFNISTTWYTAFNLTLTYDGAYGCQPCPNIFQKYLRLKSAPAGGAVSFSTNGTAAGLKTLTMPTTANPLANILMWEDEYSGLAANFLFTWELGLHFSVPGEYELCFDLDATDLACCIGCESVSRCETFVVHQWKDAWYIDISPKWNLISLPLVPFDSSVESILAPLAIEGDGELAEMAFKSIWHYDRCADDWFVYGNGQTSLTDIVDGKSYWFRMMTPAEWNLAYGALGLTGYWAAGDTARLWVFGTAKPMAPAAPAAYPVCEGWNMVGFLPPWDLTATPDEPDPQDNDAYLWNFTGSAFVPFEYGLIYGWNAGTQNWFTKAPGNVLADQLVPTQGYWIGFSRDGNIYP